jgi:Avidin family
MSLTGIWANELNSAMSLVEQPDQTLAGTYHSTVGRDHGFRALAGRTSLQDGRKQVLGFSVCFDIAEPGPDYGRSSVCDWSGWKETNGAGLEVLKTHWLLTVNRAETRDEWGATRIGEDTFLRISDKPDDKVLGDVTQLAIAHRLSGA